MTQPIFGKLLQAGALAALLFVAPLPGRAQKPTAPTAGIRVTYLVYSGRPNPTITITDPRQIAEIQKRLTDTMLTGSRLAGAAQPPVLGYNGIRIENLGDAPAAGWFVVKENVLRVEGDAAKVPVKSGALDAAADTKAAEIEGLLLSLGTNAGVLDEATLSVVRSPV